MRGCIYTENRSRRAHAYYEDTSPHPFRLRSESLPISIVDLHDQYQLHSIEARRYDQREEDVT